MLANSSPIKFSSLHTIAKYNEDMTKKTDDEIVYCFIKCELAMAKKPVINTITSTIIESFGLYNKNATINIRKALMNFISSIVLFIKSTSI